MTGRIFITGDKHGSLVPFFGLAQRNELTPADILLIAGDAGYVWREHDSSPLTTLQQLFPGGKSRAMRLSYNCLAPAAFNRRIRISVPLSD